MVEEIRLDLCNRVVKWFPGVIVGSGRMESAGVWVIRSFKYNV